MNQELGYFTMNIFLLNVTLYWGGIYCFTEWDAMQSGDSSRKMSYPGCIFSCLSGRYR